MTHEVKPTVTGTGLRHCRIAKREPRGTVGYTACAMSDVTRILAQINSGDPAAATQLLPLVYDELRRLAAAKLAQEKPGQTLQATALVHEAYLRLVAEPGDREQGTGNSEEAPDNKILSPDSCPLSPGLWDSRGHFFAAAAEAMRRILVESARRKRRLKRGGGQRRVDLNAVELTTGSSGDEVLAIHEALEKLDAEDPRTAQLVKLRYFAGLSLTEAARLLGISRSTAYEQWAYARAWLRCAIGEADQGDLSEEKN
jgi:RNA polymerase sigma factor (sigma-70 family)